MNEPSGQNIVMMSFEGATLHSTRCAALTSASQS